MTPAHIIALDAMPLAANGKLDRRALPTPDVADMQKHYVAPRNDHEARLAAIWQDVLQIARIGVHDNFFELGGHSLLATQIVSRVRADCNVVLPLRSLFESPTVAELAEAVERLSANSPASENIDRFEAVRPAGGMMTTEDRMLALARRFAQAEPDMRRELLRKMAASAIDFSLLPIPPLSIGDRPALASYAQRRLFFLWRLEPESSAYNLHAALHLEGALDDDALRGACDRLLKRHAALRTTFRYAGGRSLSNRRVRRGSLRRDGGFARAAA